MECFYVETLTPKDTELVITGEEFKHIRALRICKGDKVCIVNGKGLAAFALVIDLTKTFCKAKIISYVEELGEIDQKLDLALGILDNKERFEYAFEKGVEFRISGFYPLVTKFTQKNTIDEQRLIRKGIAALKQTLRSKLPTINPPLAYRDLTRRFKEYDKVYIFDKSGHKFELRKILNSVLVIVGPEGGFDSSEIKAATRYKNVEVVKICDYTLRSETAVVGALALISNNISVVNF
jgi:16S rRNA (uracil1498-N3)-methyltransferase